MYENEILDYQRCILRSVLIEEFNETANNKKYELIEMFLNSKKYLFSKLQLIVLKKAKAELDFFRNEGCFSCWFSENGFFESLSGEEKNEFIEILSKSPIEENNIEYYVKFLEKKVMYYKIRRFK